MYSTAVKNATIKFYDTYGADMIAAITDTNLFLPAVLAQKALESGWGKSELASKYNNLGGVKNFGSMPNAGKVLMDTAEYINGQRVIKKQPFATYSTPKIFFQEYVKVLQDPSKKYTSMGVFTATTPEEQIRRIAKAGYTTTEAEKYLSSMKSIIEACLDIYKIGKVSTAVTKPTVIEPAPVKNDSNNSSGTMAGVRASISIVLNRIGL